MLIWSSGVARIFPVGGHWGALGFRRGALTFWADKPHPPPPPKKKKKHLKLKVLIFRRNKLPSKKKKKSNHFCRGGDGEEQPFTKAYIKHILRMHKHDFCGGAKYLHTCDIGKWKHMNAWFFLWGGTKNLWGTPPGPRSYAPDLIILCVYGTLILFYNVFFAKILYAQWKDVNAHMSFCQAHA